MTHFTPPPSFLYPRLRMKPLNTSVVELHWQITFQTLYPEDFGNSEKYKSSELNCKQNFQTGLLSRSRTVDLTHSAWNACSCSLAPRQVIGTLIMKNFHEYCAHNHLKDTTLPASSVLNFKNHVKMQPLEF